MTSHELAHLLLSNNDAPITASIEIATGIYDDSGDEIIAHLECSSIVEVIANRSAPNGVVLENILHFEESYSRVNSVDVVSVVTEHVKDLMKETK
uniref:IrrE N-terminal-like domain-containing protein n=1 Tax=Vibrio phage P018-4 TaxID=3229728 RepID=A0AB39AJA4_9CAUD